MSSSHACLASSWQCDPPCPHVLQGCPLSCATLAWPPASPRALSCEPTAATCPACCCCMLLLPSIHSLATAHPQQCPPTCSLSMFTNAAGLFACGTAFDKGMRAIIINLVSGRKELPVQSCSWSCGAAWTSAQLLLPVLLGTSSAIRQAHRPIPSPLRLRLFRWWACPSALACSAVCGPLPPPRMPTRWAPGSSSPSSRCGQRPFVLGA